MFQFTEFDSPADVFCDALDFVPFCHIPNDLNDLNDTDTLACFSIAIASDSE